LPISLCSLRSRSADSEISRILSGSSSEESCSCRVFSLRRVVFLNSSRRIVSLITAEASSSLALMTFLLHFRHHISPFRLKRGELHSGQLSVNIVAPDRSQSAIFLSSSPNQLTILHINRILKSKRTYSSVDINVFN